MSDTTATAQQNREAEFRFKAAFIYHFAEFVEWPATAFADDRAPFVIGVLGRNPFGDSLKQTVEGKSLNGHPLVVKEFGSATQAVSAGVQILFIDASEDKRLAEITKALRGVSILTIVNEMPHFSESGFIINFIPAGPKIRFQISEKAAQEAHLKVNSKLLSLASKPG